MSDAAVLPMPVVRWSELDAAGRARLLDRPGTAKIFDPALRRDIGAIVEDVSDHGDAAVVRALARFDGVEVEPDGLPVAPEEFAAAERAVGAALRDALREGIANIRAFNVHLTRERAWRTEIAPGLMVGERSTPIASAGLFVPSGKGSFPSVLTRRCGPSIR